MEKEIEREGTRSERREGGEEEMHRSPTGRRVANWTGQLMPNT